MMHTLWFCLVALMLAGYVILDGFDLGVGILHLYLARTEQERRLVFRSIGSVWDGNEVWLIAAGGVLFCAFPLLYASSFSGFYLPLMLALWLLILRGLSIELRNHVPNDLWRSLWDVVFCGASLLLAIAFGAALGNVIRGVPIDASGYFFLAFFTNFQPGSDPGILDWYTVPIAIAAAGALAMHGGLWVSYKTEGSVQARAKAAVKLAWWVVVVLSILITLLSFKVQPHIAQNFAAYPWGYIFPAIAFAGLLGIWLFHGRGQELKAFLSSVGFIGGLLCTAAFGIFPYVLPSVGDPSLGLTIDNSAASPYGQATALKWFIPGIFLVALYSFVIYRYFAGKVRTDGEGY
jgi:cytochrome bd ubiquinol oxidase subunit II